jgi:hypothetical protein
MAQLPAERLADLYLDASPTGAGLGELLTVAKVDVAICTHKRAEFSGLKELADRLGYLSIHENPIDLLRINRTHLEQGIEHVQVKIVPDVAVRPEQIAVQPRCRHSLQRSVQANQRDITRQLNVAHRAVRIGQGGRQRDDIRLGPERTIMPTDRVTRNCRQVARIKIGQRRGRTLHCSQ